jgi:NADH:ubiquinone oxidoreductase subunit C
MQMLIDLCGVDYPDREPRFEVVLHLYSLKHKQRGLHVTPRRACTKRSGRLGLNAKSPLPQ